MRSQPGRQRSLTLTFVSYLIFWLCLSACLTRPTATAVLTPSIAAVPATSGPPATLAPTVSPAPPVGVFWVDVSQDLGEISKLVMGVNHGPWSDLGPGNLEPVKNLGLTFLRWPGGSWGDDNEVQAFTAVENQILR